MWPSKVKSLMDVASAVLVAVAAAAFLWTQVEARWFRPSKAPMVEAVEDLTIDSARIRNTSGGGRIALVEFTDYECPFCGEFERATAPQVERTMLEAGTLRRIVFHFPLDRIHRHARPAAKAAECAARQGRFWDMHRGLFSRQTSLTTNTFHNLGSEIGLDATQFESCLEDRSTDAIAADLREGQRLGVRATPTFFIGMVKDDGSVQLMQRINGAVSFTQLEESVRTVTQVASR